MKYLEEVEALHEAYESIREYKKEAGEWLSY